MTTLQLRIMDDGRETGSRRLPVGAAVLGRSAECEVILDHPSISSRHARVTFDGEWVVIEDLSSTNGVFLDGVRLRSEVKFKLPRVVTLGELTVHFESAAPDPEPAAVLLPERRYAPGETLGQGGMGKVLAATDQNLQRTVAMKTVHGGTRAGERTIARFMQEARVLGRLEHPNIVPIYELGIAPNGEVFYTMKKVEGSTLGQLLAGLKSCAGEPEWNLIRLLTAFQKVCDAIAFAHSQGIIHRDLKPDNIMIGKFGDVLVMDWGLAKIRGIAEPAPDGEEHSEAGTVSESRTMVGQVMGTPGYMAPEQARGHHQQVDERADIYALGAILYAILALEHPAREADDPDGQVIPPSEFRASNRATLPHCPLGKIPASLSAVVTKAMAPAKAHRYESVRELQAEIEAYQNGFVTSAEGAGLGKLIFYFLLRNRRMAGLAAIVMLGSLFALGKLIATERRAMAALRELDSAAPSFYVEAKLLTDQHQFGRALEKVQHALALRPAEPEYHVLKGHILESSFRFAEARSAYRSALKHDPAHASALRNMQLCQDFLAELNGQVNMPAALLSRLRLALLEQGRFGEASAIASNSQDSEMFAACKRVLERVGLESRLSLESSGLKLDLKGSGLTNLSLLQGMPLANLDLQNCSRIADLAPLRGMPLKELSLRGTRVTDLSPLKDLPLTTLFLAESAVTNFDALAGKSIVTLELPSFSREQLTLIKSMPLQDLNLAYLKPEQVPWLEQLKGLRLRSFASWESPITDLRFLEGMPLASICVKDSQLRDLSPLRSTSARYFTFDSTQVSDLSPLQHTKMTGLSLANSPITDLRPLENKPLHHLTLAFTPVTDLSPLAKTPTLVALNLQACTRIRDISPITNCVALKEIIAPPNATNLHLLRSLALERISFSEQWVTAREFWERFDAKKSR